MSKPNGPSCGKGNAKATNSCKRIQTIYTFFKLEEMNLNEDYINQKRIRPFYWIKDIFRSYNTELQIENSSPSLKGIIYKYLHWQSWYFYTLFKLST